MAGLSEINVNRMESTRGSGERMQLSQLYVQCPLFQMTTSQMQMQQNAEKLSIASTLNPTPIISSTLILASGLLACLELVQVPSTDVQASLVVIHALPEVADLSLACAVGALSVVGSLLLVLLSEVGGLSLLGSGLGGRATGEEPANGMADGGADCYATARIVSMLSRRYREGDVLHRAIHMRGFGESPG